MAQPILLFGMPDAGELFTTVAVWAGIISFAVVACLWIFHSRRNKQEQEL